MCVGGASEGSTGVHTVYSTYVHPILVSVLCGRGGDDAVLIVLVHTVTRFVTKRRSGWACTGNPKLEQETIDMATPCYKETQ